MDQPIARHTGDVVFEDSRPGNDLFSGMRIAGGMSVPNSQEARMVVVVNGIKVGAEAAVSKDGRNIILHIYEVDSSRPTLDAALRSLRPYNVDVVFEEHPHGDH